MNDNRLTRLCESIVAAVIQDYLEEKVALVITSDGNMKPVSSGSKFFVNKTTIQKAVHGYIEYVYKRKEFVMAMNEEQGKLIFKNWLASALAGFSIYGDVVLISNKIDVYDDTHEK